MATEPTPAKKDVQVKIQVPDPMIRGRFADQADVRFQAKAFSHECQVRFFATKVDDSKGAARDYVYGPVVLLPENAKRLSTALQQNLTRYTARFGPTTQDGEAPSLEVPEDCERERETDAPRLYANLVMVNHRPGEFTIDFIYSPPNPPFARVVLRVIVAAALARAFGKALEAAVARYEEVHGPILLTRPTPPGTIVH
jgi:hypothetical protein